MEDVKTDLLIVGAGPAGASLACFLAELGFNGLMIAAAPGTAETPRAHITNMAALECLRDIGLEKACLAAASTYNCMEHTRWCESMAGREYGRIYSWGHDPERAGFYAASPCHHVDLPQTLLEPILVERAVSRGWDCRFSTTLVAFRETPGEIESELQDQSGQTYKVRSKYLFACDGARSQIVRDLGLSMMKRPGQGLAINVFVEADLGHLVKSRVGNLHWVMNPQLEYPAWGRMALVRMVEPWTKWMFIIFPDPAIPFTEEPLEQYLQRCREIIGDESIPVKIINISKWNINETVAECYTNGNGNIFGLGDAVHRHPPFNGLGSNTCIQDAYNLAWKVAYTIRGHASPRLLSSYSTERQPVGLGVVTRANQSYREHMAVWKALGITESTLTRRRDAFAELGAVSAKGRQRREDLRYAIKGTETEFHAIGREMGQRYDESGSKAVVLEDEGPRPSTPYDHDMDYIISTYPGSRLPHSWLNIKVPQQQFSTLDLAGHGCFCLFTGPGGDAWKAAALAVSERLGIEIRAYAIGWDQDFEDVYGDWSRLREVEEEGCVLVRPDCFVGWRSKKMRADTAESLSHAMSRILGF